MFKKVLDSALPSSLKFDELGTLEIVDSQLLSTVAAGASKKVNLGNSPCVGDDACVGDSWCILDGFC